MLQYFPFIAWDGDPPEETGFTALVVDFLRQNKENKAIAFNLGRIAIKTTGSTKVISIGGGHISGEEAEASLSENVKWAILAVSRGKREASPSILDWACEIVDPNVELINGMDENESLGFCNGPPRRPWGNRFPQRAG